MASFQPNGKLYDGNGIQPDVFIEPIPTDFIGKTGSILQAVIQKLQEKDRWKITEIALETQSLTKYYGSTLAVDHLDLQIPCGCICG